MVNEILEMIVEDTKEHVDLTDVLKIFEAILKKELKAIDTGKYIKISEFGDSKDDGVYISKNETYKISIVKNSYKSTKEIDIKDFKMLLGYSNVVRALSYLQNSDFKSIRLFTKKIDSIIKKYD